MQTAIAKGLVCRGLRNWQHLATALKRHTAKAAIPLGLEDLHRRDRELDFLGRVTRRMSREARKVLNMSAVAERKAQEALAPIMVKFRNTDEVVYLRTAVEGLLKDANRKFLDAVKNGEPAAQLDALTERDRVATFANALIRQLDRKRS
jgi:hypothetical protein